MNSFVIRTYGRTELALLYSPHLCPDAAFRKLRQWIDLYPGLRENLLLQGGIRPLAQLHTRPGGADSGCAGRTLKLGFADTEWRFTNTV